MANCLYECKWDEVQYDGSALIYKQKNLHVIFVRLKINHKNFIEWKKTKNQQTNTGSVHYTENPVSCCCGVFLLMSTEHRKNLDRTVWCLFAFYFFHVCIESDKWLSSRAPSNRNRNWMVHSVYDLTTTWRISLLTKKSVNFVAIVITNCSILGSSETIGTQMPGHEFHSTRHFGGCCAIDKWQKEIWVSFDVNTYKQHTKVK